jgi:hypothetical protein
MSMLASRTPAPLGAVVTFTTLVTDVSGLTGPTCTVRFFDGATAIGTAVSLSPPGTATL